MPTTTSNGARSDHELLAVIDDNGLWVVRGGIGGPLCVAQNLRSALGMAFKQSTANVVVQAVVKLPNNAIVILPDQLHRLWQHFRFEDMFGKQVGHRRRLFDWRQYEARHGTWRAN
jgi:hypothetical protein